MIYGPLLSIAFITSFVIFYRIWAKRRRTLLDSVPLIPLDNPAFVDTDLWQWQFYEFSLYIKIPQIYRVCLLSLKKIRKNSNRIDKKSHLAQRSFKSPSANRNTVTVVVFPHRHKIGQRWLGFKRNHSAGTLPLIPPRLLSLKKFVMMPCLDASRRGLGFRMSHSAGTLPLVPLPAGTLPLVYMPAGTLPGEAYT